jgi:hypothetical protein
LFDEEITLNMATEMFAETLENIHQENRQTVKMVMNPAEFGNKNHCAGEGQQQFSSKSVSQSVSP